MNWSNHGGTPLSGGLAVRRALWASESCAGWHKPCWFIWRGRHVLDLTQRRPQRVVV